MTDKPFTAFDRSAVRRAEMIGYRRSLKAVYGEAPTTTLPATFERLLAQLDRSERQASDVGERKPSTPF